MTQSLSDYPSTSISIPDAEDLTTWYVVLLYPGPKYAGWTSRPKLFPVAQAHVAHLMQAQQPGGPALAAGPILPLPGEARDESAPVGLALIRGESLAEAERMVETDPGVRAGLFRPVVCRWLVPPGHLPA
jgi:uncharacterized protein YciI